MVIIPGIVISSVTFPGVIVHELAHQFFCWLMKIPVFEVKYFQFENPCGYVLHEHTDNPFANFIISVGPFIFNTIIGSAIVFPSMLGYQSLGFSNNLIVNILGLISFWIGISILAHAFPSNGDANMMVQSILKNEQVNILVKILVAPVVGLIYLGSLGSIIWLDFIYAISVSLLLPQLVLSLI